jgi:hypothetical protein
MIKFLEILIIVCTSIIILQYTTLITYKIYDAIKTIKNRPQDREND